MTRPIQVLFTICLLCCFAAAWPNCRADDGSAKEDKANEAKKSIKVFDGKTLTGWKVLNKWDFDGHGKVYVKDGELVLEKGKLMTGIAWTGQKLPTTDYEITLEGRRKDGSDFFCGMTFPVGQSHCSLVLGGWGGQITGLSNVDGYSAVDNETCGVMDFKQNQWYKIRVRVTKERIEAWVDREQIVDQEIKNRKIDLRWEMELTPPLGFATYDTVGGLKNIVVTRLEGEED